MKNEVVNGGPLVLAEGWLLVGGDGRPPTSPKELLEFIPKFLVKTRKVQPRGGRQEGLVGPSWPRHRSTLITSSGNLRANPSVP